MPNTNDTKYQIINVYDDSKDQSNYQFSYRNLIIRDITYYDHRHPIAPEPTDDFSNMRD